MSTQEPTMFYEPKDAADLKAMYTDPSHPHYVDFARIHPEAYASGRSPDTQPISAADYAKMQADAARGPRQAQAADRAVNAVFAVVFALMFTAALAAVALVFAGVHGALFALGLGGGICVLAAGVGASDNRPI